MIQGRIWLIGENSRTNLRYYSTSIVSGVRGAVWIDFEVKSHPNRKRKKNAVWFGSVDF